MPVNLDWTREPIPPQITAFQQYVRNVDWSKTALGSIDTWGRELRQTVRLALADSSPIIIYWGSSRTVIYNEAHIPLVGNKHPKMMGMNGSDVFPEFWSYFEEIIEKQSETGQAATGEASRLLMERHGFLEETYFDWKLVPVIGDDGTVLGVYGTPSDKTEVVIGERRALCIQTLSQHISKANSFDSLWTSIMEGIAQNETDIPFALLFSEAKPAMPNNSQTESVYKSVGSLGLPHCHPLLEQPVDIQSAESGFHLAIRQAVSQLRIIIVSSEDTTIAAELSGIQWKDPGDACTQFAIVPIVAGGSNPIVLVAGVNPHRRYNPWFQDYLQTLADVLSSALAKLTLSEELKYRADLASRAVKDFEKSEMRFSRFAARCTVGLAVTDLDGKVLYANDTWYNFSGLDPTSESPNWRDSVYEADLPITAAWWHKVTVLKQSGTFVFRSKNTFKSGHMESPYRTGLCACYADPDEAGGVETVMCLIIDISEQKWTEDQLLQRTRELEGSEQKYRNFADLCPLGIVSTDAEGYVQWGNDSWHDYYGFKKGEVTGPQPWMSQIHADDIPKAKQYFLDLQTKRGPWSAELKLSQKYTIYEGERVLENDAWVLATGMQEYRPDGSIHHIDFWVANISASKMAEKVLTEKMEEAIRTRTQQERFIDMISHEIRNPLSAVLHSSEEIVDSMKECLRDITSISSATIPGKAGINVEKTVQIMQNTLEAANTIMYCVQHQKQIVDDVLTLSKLDSDLLVVSPIPINLSDLMQTAVKIFEPELRGSDISMDIIEHESIAQHKLVWLLLDPNRFLQIVINLITNAIKFTRACEMRNIKIITSVHTEPPCHSKDLDVVPRRYNALERKDPLRLNNDDTEQTLWLRVSVSDTGKGLTADEKKLLFKRFAQASPKTETTYGGTGLGLFISRQITEMLGGEIGVGTSASGGCNFAFYVATSKIEPPQAEKFQNTRSLPPRANSAPPTSTKHEKAPQLQTPAKSRILTASTNGTERPRKVLVVEDNVVNQKVLCKQLRNRGFEVEASNHGKEALAALEKAQPVHDVILCDIEMPVMNGIQCVKEIRRREHSGEFVGHIPIIGVTANVRSQQVDAAIESGMDGVTTKPYRIDDLISHIDRFCPG